MSLVLNKTLSCSIRTKCDHPLDQLLMVLLVQLLHRDKLPLCIRDSCGKLRNALPKLFQMCLCIVEEDASGCSGFVERSDGRRRALGIAGRWRIRLSDSCMAR